MTTQVEAAADRHRHIIDRLDAVGRVEVGTLASSLDVAPETLRRDLRRLDLRVPLQVQQRAQGVDDARPQPKTTAEPTKPDDRT